MPILLVVSSPLAIRAFISVLDNKQLLFSTSGPPSGWQITLEALVDDLVSSMWPKIGATVCFFVLLIVLVLLAI